MAPQAEQLFGNVSIEFIMRDNHPYMLRLIANSYQDQNFAPPKSFGELIQLIIDEVLHPSEFFFLRQ